jgi:hypothetical protein
VWFSAVLHILLAWLVVPQLTGLSRLLFCWAWEYFIDFVVTILVYYGMIDKTRENRGKTEIWL